MSSGDLIASWEAGSGQPPASNAAGRDIRNSRPVLDFDPSTDEKMRFAGVCPNTYSGGGFTITLQWSASSATSGNTVWTTAIERIQDDVDNLDSDSFASAKSVTAAAPSTNGRTSYDSTSHSNGAEIDNLAAGESFRLEVGRDADNASDTMAGDAELLEVWIKET